jgi:hypothetical protein
MFHYKVTISRVSSILGSISIVRYLTASSLIIWVFLLAISIGIYPKWDRELAQPQCGGNTTKSHLCLSGLEKMVKEAIYATHVHFTAIWRCEAWLYDI